ncbi:hypothetical protein [Escherichia coli]|uniref:hypothetical protein n=1 Tax=Escherichia coli TaxID=562 RepID=UPI0037C11B74
MAILAIIAVIALGGYAYGFIKTRELSALRKEMKLYVDRMEAAELDLHAIRSVAEHRLHGAAKQFADLYSRIDGATVTLTPEDQLLLATMPFNIQDVEDIVNERGPKTISGRPFWEVEPGPHDYEYGPQYPYFPDQR